MDFETGGCCLELRMALILPEHTQRPYRYGMTLLCVGAMFNWLGLAENNAEPIRYIGVTLIGAGAMLICFAMCFWMRGPPATGQSQAADVLGPQIVAVPGPDPSLEKPPDYDSVPDCQPPCYDDAIKLARVHKEQAKQQRMTVVAVCGACSGGESSEVAIATKSEIAKPTVRPLADSSGPSPSGHFGTRVLRLSKRLLRRSRSAPIRGDLEAGTCPTVASPPATLVTSHSMRQLPPER